MTQESPNTETEEPKRNDEADQNVDHPVACGRDSESSVGENGRGASSESFVKGCVSESGIIGRRDYLRVLGSASVAGLIGSPTGTATAQSTFDEAAADQRIRETQMGSLMIEVVDTNGAPINGASVNVEMQEHDFGFGTALGADQLINQTSDGDPYREHLLDLFNTAVLGNQMKWRFWEENQSLADAAVDWLDQHGFRIRGHTCIWGAPDAYAIPADILTAIENDDGQTVRNRSLQHIRDIITHYGEQIEEWDVVNEALHRGQLHSAVYPGQINLDDLPAGEIQPWRSPLLADWYAEAQSVIDENGLDVGICTNDYNTLTWAYARERYASQLEFLGNQGIDLDGIGLQGHIGPTLGSGDPWSYARINQMFDHYAGFGATQRVTEFDMAGSDWSGHQQRADVMERYLKTAFGHPDVTDFLIWGMWDTTHWRSEAPFFEEDWSTKPAYDVYTGLVFDEWWTSESGTTDGSGSYVVDAFLGQHKITAETDSDSATTSVAVTDSSGTTTVTITIDASGTGDELVVNDYDGSPAWPGTNDLGQWCGGGSFQNGSGSVSNGALVVEYDDGGWLQEQINQDVSDYSTLVLDVSGATGGEESEISLSMGGASGLLSDLTSDSIGTSTSSVAVDLEAAGVDRTASSLSIRLNFWQGGTSTLTIEEIRLE
ncbi:endo-1,4-beta-xylanase [Halocatena pleomorpha]|uniref:endo-1,4-beta-xylanase n=1 Tax=Halocatena pleomorpha TaxID=1785090 RepID=A0A3P3R7R4_9EURY|nr:endo-1,4-beta-xylanase [Halocatena pleomorpha]RRJ29502.1 hypothetical protein EIK79_12760 [Halocatena pleomorpha]